jgi:hypothetical protein
MFFRRSQNTELIKTITNNISNLQTDVSQNITQVSTITKQVSNLNITSNNLIPPDPDNPTTGTGGYNYVTLVQTTTTMLTTTNLNYYDITSNGVYVIIKAEDNYLMRVNSNNGKINSFKIVNKTSIDVILQSEDVVFTSLFYTNPSNENYTITIPKNSVGIFNLFPGIKNIEQNINLLSNWFAIIS